MKTTTPKTLLLLLSMGISGQVLAKTYTYPAIYPFVPMDQQKIYEDVKRVSEDSEFIRNFNDIINQDLSKAKTKHKPWTSSYWPLSKGTIADPYEKDKISYYVDTDWYDWEKNYDKFQDRIKEKLANVDNLSEEELAKLAPSEKYDLLLGDKGFDLTKRLWEYMRTWGKKKEWGFIKKTRDANGDVVMDENGRPKLQLFLVGEDALTLAQKFVTWGWFKNTKEAFKNAYQLQDSLSVKNALTLVDAGMYDTVDDAFMEALDMAKEQAKNYKLSKKSKLIAAWEGICNGWSTAAGVVPRPRKAVDFTLKNGKKLKFYPEDIKGLVSLYWVNSLAQDGLKVDKNGNYQGGGTVSAGLRCNLKNAKKDVWGRKYDHKADPFNKDHSPRCVGVHPAVWHLGLVNIIGKQQRSFVVERKVGEEVDNHPMYSYKMKYFNPNTGRSKDSLHKNIEPINDEDQFLQFRNKNAKYIVGVETTMTYLDYMKPDRKETNSEKDDEEVDKKMYYDLELDENYNIVGGQWRAVKVGAPVETSGSAARRNRLNHNQPDFFWTVTKKASWDDSKDITKLFSTDKTVTKWKDTTAAPPVSWLAKAQSYHDFYYQQIFQWGNGRKCTMVNKETGKFTDIACEMETNRPQPFINVLKVLVNKSK